VTAPAVSIERGSTRLVLLIGHLALKIARNESGLDCNRREAATWRQVSDERRLQLCPVLATRSEDAVIVMPRLKMLTQREHESWCAAGGYFDLALMPGEFEIGFEPGVRNWGWLNGRPVAVDYALPMSPTGKFGHCYSLG
jgi:hypothetical protein